MLTHRKDIERYPVGESPGNAMNSHSVVYGTSTYAGDRVKNESVIAAYD